MKINSTKKTQRILQETTPQGSKLRRMLLKLRVGESLTLSVKDWPFKSEPAEYLYTMRRIERTYSYRTLENNEILILRTT